MRSMRLTRCSCTDRNILFDWKKATIYCEQLSATGYPREANQGKFRASNAGARAPGIRADAGASNPT